MKHRRLLFLFFMIVILGQRGGAGIYLCYWMASVQNGIKARESEEMNGILWLILSLATLGIGFLIWQWRTCTWLKNRGCRDLRIGTLILSLLLIGLLINPFLIQNQINCLITEEYSLNG